MQLALEQVRVEVLTQAWVELLPLLLAQTHGVLLWWWRKIEVPARKDPIRVIRDNQM